MYKKAYYKGKSETEIKESAIKEGFDPLKISNDSGFVYSLHHHAETKLIAFLQGSMRVKVADVEYDCQAGDRLVITGNVHHSAIVGPDGCIFFWAEKL